MNWDKPIYISTRHNNFIDTSKKQSETVPEPASPGLLLLRQTNPFVVENLTPWTLRSDQNKVRGNANLDAEKTWVVLGFEGKEGKMGEEAEAETPLFISISI